MSTLERIAEMEERLLRAWDCRLITANDNEVRASLHAFAMRVAQSAAVVFAAEMMNEGTEAFASFLEVKAMERFPLPPKRVLREEPDTDGSSLRWRYSGGRLEYQVSAGCEWLSNGLFCASPSRIDLWHSLKHEPYREVPANGED